MSLIQKEYLNFCRLKGIKSTYNKHLINQAIKHNKLIITTMAKETKKLSFHVYINNNEKVRLLYSISNFRTEGSDNQLVGRANKFLHFKDIIEFKNKGYIEMDWGGVSSPDLTNGIDKFKAQFGGKLELRYFSIGSKYKIINKILIRKR